MRKPGMRQRRCGIPSRPKRLRRLLKGRWRIKAKLVNHKLRTSLKPIKVNGINWVRKLPRNLQVNCLLP